MQYEIKVNEMGNEYIVRTNDDKTISLIPNDPANSDYQAYLNKDNPKKL